MAATRRPASSISDDAKLTRWAALDSLASRRVRLDVGFDELGRGQRDGTHHVLEHPGEHPRPEVNHHHVGEQGALAHRLDAKETTGVVDVVREALVEPEANDGGRAVGRGALAPYANGVLAVDQRVALFELDDRIAL